MDEDDARAVLGKFLAQVRSQPGWDLSPWPEWYGQAITAVTLLVDGEEVEYLTGEFDGTEGVLHFYTSTTVITLEVTTDAVDGTAATTTARRRSTLVSLDLSASGSLSGGDAGAIAWPGNVQAVVRYEDGHVLTAPVAQAADEAERTRFLSFLPSPRRDVRG